MFQPRSRYSDVPTDTISLKDGRKIVVVRFPRRPQPSLAGYHRRLDGQRLDHIAAIHLSDPTGFWRLCDAGGAVSPDAMAARELIAVPTGSDRR